MVRRKSPARRSRRSRGASRVARKRNQNLAVRKIQRVYRAFRRRKPTQTKANTASIFTLARQVRTLQQQKFGPLQRSYHISIASDNHNTTPDRGTPLAFCLNDFYHHLDAGNPAQNFGGYFFKGDLSTSGTPPQTVPTYARVGRWEESGYNNALAPQYNWTAETNFNRVSFNQYLPLSTHLTFRFRGEWPTGGSGQPPSVLRFRITVLKVKWGAGIKSGADATDLNWHIGAKNARIPADLGAYRDMCTDDWLDRNHFNPKYHKVLKEKWITMRPPNPSVLSASAAYRNKIDRSVKMNWQFKGHKPMRPVIHNSTSYPVSEQTFVANTNQKDQIWLIVSSNLPESDPTFPSVTLDMRRKIVWRDPHLEVS